MSRNRTICICFTLMLGFNVAWANPERSVTVNGTGFVEVKPDIARIQMTVSERNPSL